MHEAWQMPLYSSFIETLYMYVQCTLCTSILWDSYITYYFDVSLLGHSLVTCHYILVLLIWLIIAPLMCQPVWLKNVYWLTQRTIICTDPNILYGLRTYIGWSSFWFPNYIPEQAGTSRRAIKQVIHTVLDIDRILGSHKDAKPTPTTASPDFHSSQEKMGKLFDLCRLTCSLIAPDLYYFVKPQTQGVKNDDTEPSADSIVYEGDVKR